MVRFQCGEHWCVAGSTPATATKQEKIMRFITGSSIIGDRTPLNEVYDGDIITPAETERHFNLHSNQDARHTVVNRENDKPDWKTKDMNHTEYTIHQYEQSIEKINDTLYRISRIKEQLRRGL